MPRFFHPFPLSLGAEITLPDAISHHIHVLRLAIGDPITLFNGEGGEYLAHIIRLEKKRIFAEIKAFSPREAELAYALTLAQALPEGSKMDWIIEKAAELGVTAITPLAAQRSVVKLNAERAERKLEHWQGIAIAASEQCGRNRVMSIAAPVRVSDWLAQPHLHTRILFSPRATESLATWARHQPPQAATLMIGPEGGWSEQEEISAAQSGALLLSLGARVLRTETAGLAAVAALNAMWGEL